MRRMDAQRTLFAPLPSRLDLLGMALDAAEGPLPQTKFVLGKALKLGLKPIAQRKLDSLLAEGYTISGYSVYHERKHQHGFVTGAGLVGWWNPDGVEYPHPRGEQEPDWSDSKTLPSELWKNPLLSLQERLQIADGAVQWNREVAENLRARLRAAQQPQGEQEPLAWIREEWSSRTLNFDGPPTVPSVRDELTKPVWTPLYTHPQPKRELTDDEARRIYNEATYHASIAVFMTRMDAEHQDADDKGVSGWLQEDEDRVKCRIIGRAPLTNEQIDGIIRDLDPSWLDTPTGFEEEFCRAIERAHGIK
jgi:hypothetical protein